MCYIITMKEEKLKVQGIVIKKLPNCEFVVECDFAAGTHNLRTFMGRQGVDRVLAYLCGKMRKNKIFVDKDDEVTVELSPYNLSKGRIIRRV